MRLMKSVFLALVSASAITLFSSGAYAQDVIKLRLAVPTVLTSWMTQGDLHLAEVVKQRTNGRLQIEVIYGGALGPGKETAGLLRTGALDMANMSPWEASEFVREFDVLAVAFAFRGWDHLTQLLNDPGFTSLIDEAVEARKPGFRVLYMSSGGTRNLYNKVRPISTLEELQGIKMRSPGSPLITATWTALGTHTTPVDWTEMYTALQTGVIEAAENTLNGVLSAKLYEICKYLTRSAHNFDMSSVLISDQAWNKLPADLQSALVESAKETRAWVLQQGRASEDKIADELAAKGVRVLPGLKDRGKWAERVQPVNGKLAKEIGLYGEKILAYITKK